jgi:hypothetical protein
MLIPKPNSIQEDLHSEPEKLFIFAHTKCGKTSLVEGLPNHFLIDLENGSKFVKGTKLNIRDIALKEGRPLMDILDQIVEEIKTVNKAKGQKVYDFGVLDTITALEDIAKDRALEIYKSLPIAASFKGNDVLLLPKGAGYTYIRMAFEEIYNKFDNLFNKGLIVFGHVKNSSITKEGKELSTRDINLAGKLKTIACAGADAIGYMYRDESGVQNIISFKTSEDDLASGARPKHLRNQEIVISRLNEDDTLSFYWDKIYLSLEEQSEKPKTKNDV